MLRLATVLFCLLLAAPSGGAVADPLRLALFSGVDREAVELGGLLQIDLEVLAVPVDEAAHRALETAFRTWDVPAQLGPGFVVVRADDAMAKVTGDVVEMQRRVFVRVVSDRVEGVPALRLGVVVGGEVRTYETRPHAVQTFGRDDAIDAVERSVVAVTAEGVLGGTRIERIGSAFVIGDDALVTAYHVVVGARRVRVRLPDGDVVVVDRAWALDPVRDVAVLHLPAAVVRRAGLRPLVIAPEASSGRVAFTVGWPEGVQRRTVAVRFPDLELAEQRVRLAANAVLPGDSGGPLLDAGGRVLGVVVSGRQTDGRRDLLAESISLASNPVPAVRAYHRAERPTPLARALDHAARALPAARAHAAVGAILVPTRRADEDRRPHVAGLRDALRAAPSDAVLQYMAGMMLEEVGEDRLAAGALDASRRAGYAPAGYSLAHHLLRRGHLGDAATLFAETSACGPYRRLAAFGQAKALVGLGRYAHAEAMLETVLDHDARFAPALYLLGVVRLAQGRVEEARALTVRLAASPAWAEALRLPVEVEALRPPTLETLPRVALR